MQHQLKDLYGRRITSTVKLFILVVLILLGVHLVFGGKGRRDQSNAYGDMTGQSPRSEIRFLQSSLQVTITAKDIGQIKHLNTQSEEHSKSGSGANVYSIQ